MDRRSLLAIALSMIVIAVFNFYFIPKPKKPESPQAETPIGEPGAAAIGEPHRSVSGTAPAAAGFDPAVSPDSLQVSSGDVVSAPDAIETTFEVRSEKSTARFTTRGGGLQSYILHKFGGPTGGPVEMVREGPEPHVQIDLGSRVLDLSTLLFKEEQQSLSGGGTRVIFRAGVPGGVQVTKQFDFVPGSELIDFQVDVTGLPYSDQDPKIQVGWTGGIPQAELNAKTDESTYGAVLSVGKNIERVHAGKFKKENEKTYSGAVHWVAARNKYFMAAIVPAGGDATDAMAVGDATTHRAGAVISMPLAVGGTSIRKFHLYAGPLDYWRLKDVGFGLEAAVDLGMSFILPLSKLLLWLLVKGYSLIPNYGVVIILLSAVTKIVFYPMTKSSMRSMRDMQKLQPEMEALRKKYKDDPKVLNEKVMNLYKTHKVNPVGGCLPMLLQMPVFFALYSVLANSVELRQAGFVGWINDLSAPDTLFTIGSFGIHILPVLMAGSMLWQQKLTPTDPRQAAMMYLMPVMMLFFLYSFPSGLALYWTVINLLSVGQQVLINRESHQPAAA